MRLLMLSLAVVISAGATAAACGDSEETGSFCDPGAFVFCRCANGDPGSKECNSEGDSFGACMAETGGECPDRGDSSSSDPTSTGDPGPSSSSSGSGGGSGEGELYAACAGDSECQSGLCAADGYCTQDCASYEECDFPNGDCPGSTASTPTELKQKCAPACGGFDSTIQMLVPDPGACDDFGLYCGWVQAADGFDALVCASWEDVIPLPPDGTECDYERFGHTQCNLGYQGAQAVCTGFGSCTKGCYEPEDCPDGTTCSGGGSALGNCN